MKRISPNTTKNARNLRKNMTDVERLLWQKLRNKQLNNWRFRRQYSMGKYIVDFICLDQKLIIELDGSQHFDNKEYDQNRDSWLNEQGFRVLRFWNNEVLENMTGVLEVIMNISPPSPPSP